MSDKVTRLDGLGNYLPETPNEDEQEKLIQWLEKLIQDIRSDKVRGYAVAVAGVAGSDYKTRIDAITGCSRLSLLAATTLMHYRLTKAIHDGDF